MIIIVGAISAAISAAIAICSKNRNDNAETQKNDSLYEGFFRSVNILDSDYADCCGGCEFV